MTNAIIDIADQSVDLRASNSLLTIETSNGKESIPLAEIAALILAANHSTISQAALAGIAEAGGAVVVCGDQFMPTAMLLPLDSHYIQTERLGAQIRVSEPTRKRIWRDIVRAKVSAQADLLEELHDTDFGLRALLAGIRSGDPSNVEAQAARVYWSRLFADPAFRRRRDGEDQNRFLNYGYAVIRAIVARAICATGLHPSIGVQHHNRYDNFCLASDLMEPFRPLVDRVAYRICESDGPELPLSPEVKRAILQPLYGKYQYVGERRTLFDIVEKTAKSLANVYLGEQRDIVLPKHLPTVEA